MLFTSPVYSQASGSIAGITYSHNRGGMYTRARVTPTDPSSSRQQQMRSIMGTLAPYWGDTLTQVQRDAWNLYAGNIDWLNPLGQLVFLTGQQHFNRCNTVRMQILETILEDAPTNFNLGTFTLPTIAAAHAAGNVDIAFDNTDAWANAVGGYMVTYAGRSQGPGRAFYRGPWRQGGAIVGAAVPEDSPKTLVVNQTWTLDSIVWVQIRVIQEDGRVSLPVILGPEIVVA